jgi:hypothetical protein
MYLSMASCQRTASLRLPTTTIALARRQQRRDVLAEVLDDDLHLLAML